MLNESYEPVRSSMAVFRDEILEVTVTGIHTPNGLQNLEINGTVGQANYGTSVDNIFTVENYSIADSTGSLDVMGTSYVEAGSSSIVFRLDMTLAGEQFNPANPSTPLALRTEARSEGITFIALDVRDEPSMREGVFILSAPDGSSVRAEASDSGSIANITLTGGGSSTLDSRPWSELVPRSQAC